MTLEAFMWALILVDSVIISLFILAVIINRILERIERYRHRNDKPLTREQLDYLRLHDPSSIYYLPPELRSGISEHQIDMTELEKNRILEDFIRRISRLEFKYANTRSELIIILESILDEETKPSGKGPDVH